MDTVAVRNHGESLTTKCDTKGILPSKRLRGTGNKYKNIGTMDFVSFNNQVITKYTKIQNLFIMSPNQYNGTAFFLKLDLNLTFTLNQNPKKTNKQNVVQNP